VAVTVEERLSQTPPPRRPVVELQDRGGLAGSLVKYMRDGAGGRLGEGGVAEEAAEGDCEEEGGEAQRGRENKVFG
jgi:hypothetical protein